MLDFVKYFLSPGAASEQGTSTPTRVSLLFLDIDGVLNSQNTREEGDHMPADVLLDNLAHIVQATLDTQIVLSSTWRLEEHNRRAVQFALGSRQLTLLSSTPDLETFGDRVDEILAWMNSHSEYEVTAWIAVDDMDLIKMNTKLDAEHFVWTDDAHGLTREKAEEAVGKLLAQQRAMR